ncbi:hypothetical protein, partial [Sporosarcina sp. OR05]|uniref:hypothetical protein n=1 Tax=Sporosarcina sp. OR05 TaxID=2969819 RepID=UPI00352B05C4
DALMRLFGVADKKTYKNNTGRFKKTVLDVAITEINTYTELEVWYTEEKSGRAIVGFDLHWTTGKNTAGATKGQIRELIATVDVIHRDMFTYINLKNDENRKKAIDIVRETEEIKIITEDPICITREYADILIKKAVWNLQELERLLKTEHNPKPFYNWLEEREDAN